MADPTKPEDLNDLYDEIIRNLKTIKVPLAGKELSKLPKIYQDVTKAFEDGLVKTAEDVKQFFINYTGSLQQMVKTTERRVTPKQPLTEDQQTLKTLTSGGYQAPYRAAFKNLQATGSPLPSIPTGDMPQYQRELADAFKSGLIKTQKDVKKFYQDYFTKIQQVVQEQTATVEVPTSARGGQTQDIKTTIANTLKGKPKEDIGLAGATTKEGEKDYKTTGATDKDTAAIAEQRNRLLAAEQRAQEAADREAKTREERTNKAKIRGDMSDSANKRLLQAQENQVKFAEEVLSKNKNAAGLLANRDPRFADPNVARITTQNMPNEHTRITSTFKDENDQMQKATVITNKYGDAVERVPRNLRTFGAQLAINYAEVLKWSIAVGLLYTPMRKLSELTQVMIENQTRLAQVAVTLGASQEVVNKIFIDASKVAKQTGTDLGGVIEGYNMAFRATGNAATMSERFTRANERLIASITLAKLANIEQSTATDILTATIGQLGEAEKENNGVTLTASMLLDKWVTVSKVANVDVNTLATSFSIVGEAATAAGLSVDQLNGLIATVAEKSSLSARETGNAVRAIISGFQTDAAEKTLRRYGIAVKNSEDEIRSFSQVFGDIKQQFEQGLITPAGLSDIARVMSGQGNRRQAQEIMAIMGLPRMNEIAGVSANAPADAAAKAMAQLVDTIGAQLENLNTDFQVLAQTLGTSGGILDATTSVIRILDQFTIALTGVSKALGTALPFLVGIGAVSLIAGKNSPLNLFGQMSSVFISGRQNARYGSFDVQGNRVDQPQQVGGLMGQQWAQTVLNRTGNIASRIGEGVVKWAPAIGIGIGSYMMISARAAAGDKTGAWGTAGLTLAGAAIGLLGGPAGVALGATIGTAIGESIATGAQRRKEELAAIMAITAPGEKLPTPETKTTQQFGEKAVPETALAYVFGQNYQAIEKLPGFLNEQIKSGLLDPEQKLTDAITNFTNAYKEWASKPENAEAAKQAGEVNPWDVLEQLLKNQPTQNFSGQQVIPVNWGNFQWQAPPNVSPLTGTVPTAPRLTPEQADALIKSIRDATEKAAQSPVEQSQYLTEIFKPGGFGDDVRNTIKKLQQDEIAYLQKRAEVGELSPTQFTTQKANVNVAMGQITKMAYPAVKGGMNQEEALQTAADIITRGTAEEIKSIVNYANEIQDLYNKIAAARKIPGGTVADVINPETGEKETKMAIDAAQGVYDGMLKQIADMLEATEIELKNRVVLTPRIDFTKKGYTKEDIMGPIVEGAKEFNDKIYQGYIDAAKQMEASDPAQAKELRNMADAYRNAQLMSGGVLIAYENGTVYVPGISAESITAGETLAKEKSTLSKGIDINQWDVTKSQVPELTSIYNRILSQFKGAGYTPNLENTVVYTKDKDLLEFLYKDGQDKRIDAKVMQIALGELNDKAQKQLDGMYNLPEGATFYVPYQAAVMSRNTVNAQAGLDTAALGENTTAVNNSTEAMNRFADFWMNLQKGNLTEAEVGRGKVGVDWVDPADIQRLMDLGKRELPYKQYLPTVSTNEGMPMFRKTEIESMQDYRDMQDRYDKMNAGVKTPELQTMPMLLPPLTNALTTLISGLSAFNLSNMQGSLIAKIDATIPLTTNVQVLIGAQQLAAVVIPIVKKEIASALGRFSNSTTSSVGGSGGPAISY